MAGFDPLLYSAVSQPLLRATEAIRTSSMTPSNAPDVMDWCVPSRGLFGVSAPREGVEV